MVLMAYCGLIDRYRKFLPVSEKTQIVSLSEGQTPLIYSQTLTDLTGCRVYLKYEGLNPTGSFKDRGMTMAITRAKEEGAHVVMCASTGNTSASAAAYAARAKMKCVVLIPEGNIAMGKLAQALIHGAKVLAIKGNFDVALKLVRTITDKYPITLVNSLNPYRIVGQKTGAFEICDDLNVAPDYHAIPVGNAGNITAYWKGYKEYQSAGIIKDLPRMLGFQAKGAAPIVFGKLVKHPKTIATAIKIGNPASWTSAEAARDESGGLIDAVTDAEILKAYMLLAAREGVFCEPASAASVAGILKLAKVGYFKKAGVGPDRKIVCVLTGHGLKDPDRAIASIKKPRVCKPDLKIILKEIGF
jgi:threonine synthase